MLHKTVVARDPDELAGIVDLQVRLLQLAAHTNQIDKKALEHWFNDSDLVDYVTQNFSRVIGALKDFARECPPADKGALISEVIDEIEHDANFWNRYGDPSFVLKFTGTGNPHRQHIATWLKGFYEQFSKSGFPFLSPTGSQPWNKHAWEDAFREKNRGVQVCPQCDGTMHNGVTVEHIFPRAKYPALSVHVANLIPCCENCQREKANKDPIQVAPPRRLFLPYWQHALEHCDVKAIQDGSGGWKFALVPRAPGADWQDAITQMGHLYGIPDQWSQRINWIVDLAYAKIEEKLYADRDEEQPVRSLTELQKRLDSLCANMKKQWGKQHYFVPTTAWLEWAKDNMLDQLWAQFGEKNIAANGQTGM
ncbi:MAG: hypothetical protein RMJ54_14650 [Roseiflexaceae bacterium]|nr:hypothetical protein [Roseiflexus sp.]MDW8234017.1 hypothetical protein [Roseiflexaceae bacterium]